MEWGRCVAPSPPYVRVWAPPRPAAPPASALPPLPPTPTAARRGVQVKSAGRFKATQRTEVRLAACGGVQAAPRQAGRQACKPPPLCPGGLRAQYDVCVTEARRPPALRCVVLPPSVLCRCVWFPCPVSHSPPPPAPTAIGHVPIPYPSRGGPRDSLALCVLAAPPPTSRLLYVCPKASRPHDDL